jgi:DNA-binding LytR/AlgR family response regulator
MKKIKHLLIYNIKENSHKTKLSLRLGDLFYVESSDNYVLIFYSNGDKLEKRVLRNSIKQLEQELIPYEIIRCHRSYMINPINVSRKEKTTKGLNLFFRKFEEVVVPVSKSYASELEKILA